MNREEMEENVEDDTEEEVSFRLQNVVFWGKATPLGISIVAVPRLLKRLNGSRVYEKNLVETKKFFFVRVDFLGVKIGILVRHCLPRWTHCLFDDISRFSGSPVSLVLFQSDFGDALDDSNDGVDTQKSSASISNAVVAPRKPNASYKNPVKKLKAR